MATRKRFLLRIDPELFDELERWAHDELRSINAQIEFLLEESLRRANRHPRGRRRRDARSNRGGQ